MKPTTEQEITCFISELSHKLDKILDEKANHVKPKILTLDESAKYLSFSKSKLKNLIKDELIDPPSKIGGNYFYEIDYLDYFVVKHRNISYQEIAEAVSKTILGLNKRKSVF
jgi:hypothetical protein